MVSRQSPARMNNNQIRRKNPISFQLAFSHLEIFANQLWRTSLPDKVDFVYGRIWLHTLELAHRWKQTTAEDALAGIDFSFDGSTEQSRSAQFGRGNSSENDSVWCHPRWRSTHLSVSAKTSEKCGCGEGRLGRLLEIHDGGVEKEKFKNFAEAFDSNQLNWFQYDSNYPSLRNVTNHRHEYLARCSLVPGEGMLETAKYNPDTLFKNESVYCDQLRKPSSGINEADWDALRNCVCYSNPFDPRLYFKGIFPSSVKHPESKNSASETQNGKTLTAATVSSMTNQHTENLFLSICNISAAFEQYVSGYRLFRLSLVRAPSISVPDDNQLSPRFRFSEPGCLGQADVVSLIRIPVDLSGADDGLIRLVQAIQSDQVRLLWLLPSSSSASPPLSYLPPPNEKNRSNPGPIRRPFAVPWRLRHKNAYATSRSRSRHSFNASLQDILENDQQHGACDSRDVTVNSQSAVLNTNAMVPLSSFIQMPKPVAESASVYSSAKHAVGSTRRPASASTMSHIPRPNCLLKRKISCARQDVGSKKDWSRLSTWSRALSTKGRLWDDNDLLVTESSKDFDDLITRHRLLVRRSLSDPDLCSLTSEDRKQAAGVASVQCFLPGKQLQHHGDLNISGQGQGRHLFSSYPMAWVPGRTGKTGDEVSYHSRSAKTLNRNSDVMPCQFEELWVSSGLERASSNPLAPPHPLCEQLTKSTDSSSVKETTREDSASKTIRIGHGVTGGIPLVRLVAPRKLAAGQCIVLPASPHVGTTVASSSSFHHCTDVVLWKNPGLVVLHHPAPPVGLKPSLPGEMENSAESRCVQRRVVGSGVTPLIRLNAVPTEPYKALLPPAAPSSQSQNVRLVAHQSVQLGRVLVNQPRVMVPCPTLSVQRLHSGDIVDAGEPDRLCVVRDLPSPNPSFHHTSFPQCVIPRTVTQVLPVAHNQPLRSGLTKNSLLDSCGGGGWISSWQPPSHSTFSTFCHPRPETTGICFATHQPNPFSLAPQRLSYPTAILKRSLTDDVASTANRFGDVALSHSDNRVLVPHLAFHSSSLERAGGGGGGVEFQRPPGGALITDMKPCANLNAEAVPFISHKFLGPSNSQTFSLGLVCPQWPPMHEPTQSLQLDTK